MKRRHCFAIAIAVLVLCSGPVWAHPGGITQAGPNLPPDGVYLSPSDVHAMYSGPALAIVLTAIQHQPFALLDPNEVRPDGSEHEHFSSTLKGQGQCNGMGCAMAGIPSFFDVFMEGDVRTEVQGLHSIPQPGPYMTEMLEMNLTGMGGVMIRESPSKQSLGQTSITDVGGGMYHIDSFFDVFTELSLDGGQSWMPSNVDGMGNSHPTHVTLYPVPEPASVVLIGLALVGVAGLVRRK